MRFLFLVGVEVEDIEPGSDQDRTPAGYALAALNTAGLPDAGRLDGFADLPWVASITSVEHS
jgi:hypothetical protein